MFIQIGLKISQQSDLLESMVKRIMEGPDFRQTQRNLAEAIGIAMGVISRSAHSISKNG